MDKKCINSTSVTNWDAYGLSEYLLMAHTSNEVHEKVMKEKECFDIKYGLESASKSIPHISVAAFLGRSEMERELDNVVQNICNQFRAYNVTLCGYNGFAPKAIYLSVQNHEPFKKLAKGLKAINDFLKSQDYPIIRLFTHPHLTIARRLQEHIYFKAINEYKRQSLFESFTMSELVLIKRPRDLRKCQQVSTYNLLPTFSTKASLTSTQLKLDL